MRRVYLSHAWKPDKPVKYLGESENEGYAWIKDEMGRREVPVDILVFKEDNDPDDLL